MTTESMSVCVVAPKPCWRNAEGQWFSNGGFPIQMAGIVSLFDSARLLIADRGSASEGGIALPRCAVIATMPLPQGADLARKRYIAAHIVRYVRLIMRHIRDVDVVHIPVPGDIGLITMVLSLLLRKRTIVRYSGSWLPTRESTIANRVTRGLMRMCAGGRNVMLATGDGVKPPARGISWIFSTALRGAEIGDIRPDLGRGLGDPVQLAYIGRLSEEKGVAVLIDAMELLKKESTGSLPRVSIIGEGLERQRLETRAARGEVLEYFRFTGQLDRRELSRVLHGMDICVQPSLTEGFSKAWLDAFAHGLPVLASDVGAARQVIGDDGERGWLVPPGDARALATRIRSVMTRQEGWPGLRTRCRAYVEGRTIEDWGARIGMLCALQWNGAIVGGKLRL